MGDMADALIEAGLADERPAHHPLFPPSSSKRWLTCTASPLPISHGYEGSVSYAAAEGSVAHEVFAKMLAGHEPPLGEHIAQEGHSVLVTMEMVNYLQQCVDYVVALGPGVMLVEQLVELAVVYTDEDDTETITGHADVLKQTHAEPDLLHVLDLKYGKGVRVYAADNTQMMLYGTMSAHTHDFVFEDIKRVRVHVLQPRLEVFEYEEYTIAELEGWVDDAVLGAVREVHGYDEGPTLRPSEEACQWCPLLGQCPAAQSKAVELFDEVPMTDAEAGSKADAEKGVALMPATDLGDFLQGTAFFELVVRAARARALDLLLAREEVPGWKMVESSSNRVWDNEVDGEPSEEALEAAAAKDGVVLYADPPIRSVADIERQLGKKDFSTSHLAALVVKPQGKPRLAPADDKRPAWHPDDGNHFD